MKKIVVFVMMALVLALGVNAVAAQRVNPQQPNDPGMLRQIVSVIAEQTGLTAAEIVEALQADGATVASVIEANGGSVDATVAGVVAAITEHVNAQLEAGAITAERAERQLTNLDAIVLEALEGEGYFGNVRGNARERMGERGRGEGRPRGGADLMNAAGSFGIRPLIGATADALDLELTALTSQLRAGETLGAIIDASGGDQSAIIADALALVDERLTQAVANGRITDDQKASTLTVLETLYTEFMSWTHGAI